MSAHARQAVCNAIAMVRGRGVAALFATVVMMATVPPAQAFLTRPVIFATVGGTTAAPSGWLQYCTDHPAECQPTPAVPHDVLLTPDLLQQLFTINAFVNDRVKWTSDAELFGKSERWAMPLDRGDCEDIVLLKRKMLAAEGWPIGALLITTVQDPQAKDSLHAVLTVRTDRGEFILDNQTPEVLFWYETPYRFLKRQSATDPNVWVSFADSKASPILVATPR